MHIKIKVQFRPAGGAILLLRGERRNTTLTVLYILLELEGVSVIVWKTVFFWWDDAECTTNS